MKYFFLLTSLFPFIASSQPVHFNEIKLKPIPKYYNTQETTIVYPVVITDNRSISQLINNSIKRQLLDVEGADKMSTREALIKATQSGLTDLTYDITYNRNGILSLKIHDMFEAAYPSSSHQYLNFDTRTGRCIRIKDILRDNMLIHFKTRVRSDKLDSLKRYKDTELKGLLLEKELDSAEYQSALQLIEGVCIDSVDINNFSIYDTGIEIIDQCDFPHFIKGIEPIYQPKYSYPFMAAYLKPAFQARLHF